MGKQLTIKTGHLSPYSIISGAPGIHGFGELSDLITLYEAMIQREGWAVLHEPLLNKACPAQGPEHPNILCRISGIEPPVHGWL